MNKSVGGPKRILVTLYVVALHVGLIYLIGERFAGKYIPVSDVGVTPVGDPTERPDAPTPIPIPSLLTDDPAVAAATLTDEPLPGTPSQYAGSLMIPVQGVRPDQLVDTFAQARSNGRAHDAIDIMAPGGTPVVAAVDGEIVNFFDSVAGGTTIYQLSTDRRFIYYYAHLQRRADDLRVGDVVKQGKVIAYVGDTGNAGSGNYHLHFSIAQANDPKRFWEGAYLNPYPYLKSGRAPEIK